MTLAGELGPWALAGQRDNDGMAGNDDRAGARARKKHQLRATSSDFDFNHDGELSPRDSVTFYRAMSRCR